MSVREAARRLDVSERRVRQLISADVIAAEKFGSSWMVSNEDVARLAARRRPPGRPLGPRRAWALLDLLDGGEASWLSASGRSQVRSSLRRLTGSGDDSWRAALQGRSHVRRCVAHPAAVDRLASRDDVLLAGTAVAIERGFDLVVPANARPEIYARDERWAEISRALAIRDADDASANLIVRLPKRVWPFHGGSAAPDAVLAADLLESAEPRAAAAASAILNAKLTDLLRVGRQ